MNPFDLRGPEFLVFYLFLTILVCAVVVLLRNSRESGEGRPAPKLNDPYLIAYLRGGKHAAITSALVSLVDRKLVNVDPDTGAARSVKRTELTDPLEKALMVALDGGLKPDKLKDLDFPVEFESYKNELRKLALMPDFVQRAQRRRDILAGCLLLASIAGIKIIVALSRGRTNLLFLCILCVAAMAITVALGSPRLTSFGRRIVEDMKNLFYGLQKRAENIMPGRSATELALLTALFGVAAVPVTAFPIRDRLFKRAEASSSSSSGCGSSCGSSGSSSSDSGGSSCGSSCGGGGGGCGGCGS